MLLFHSRVCNVTQVKIINRIKSMGDITLCDRASASNGSVSQHEMFNITNSLPTFCCCTLGHLPNHHVQLEIIVLIIELHCL